MTLDINEMSPVQAYSLAFSFHHAKNNSAEIIKPDFDKLSQIIVNSDKTDLALNWLRCIPNNEDRMVDKICQVNKSDVQILLAALELPISYSNTIKIKYKILDLLPDAEELKKKIIWLDDYSMTKFYDGLPPEVQLGVKL